MIGLKGNVFAMTSPYVHGLRMVDPVIFAIAPKNVLGETYF